MRLPKQTGTATRSRFPLMALLDQWSVSASIHSGDHGKCINQPIKQTSEDEAQSRKTCKTDVSEQRFNVPLDTL